MQVKLKVVGGKHNGREIALNVPRFIIGRGEKAHLRPNSDLISREHCAIEVGDGKVIIRDLESRNGTIVNGELLTAEHEARVGDLLRVGRLQFEVLIDHVESGLKKPKVQGVADAARRVATSDNRDVLNEDSITDWLSDPGVQESTPNSLTETRQFQLEETSTRLFVRSDEMPTDGVQDSKDTDKHQQDSDSTGSGFFRKKKKPLKMPIKAKELSQNSKSAADDVLRKFFNRR